MIITLYHGDTPKFDVVYILFYMRWILWYVERFSFNLFHINQKYKQNNNKCSNILEPQLSVRALE